MTDAMTDDEKRRDQLLAAPNATEEDAAPRIDVTEHDGVKRIDIRDDAAVRPGNPEEDPVEDGNPSQAEGEDPARPNRGEDPAEAGHPSQAEGEDPARSDR